MADVTGDYLALRRDVAAFRTAREVVRVSGPDAVAFLQGQLSQDVAGIEVGGAAWSLLLEPQGKVVAWLRAWRVGPDEVLLDVDHGRGEVVVARLQRFLLRTRCEIEAVEHDVVALRGPRSTEVAASLLAEGGAERSAPVTWSGVQGVDVVGAPVALPDDLRLAGFDAFESVRIEAGWPAAAELPVDPEPSVIPGEAGQWLVDASVSFTKGCYTGQELVARIDSRGNNTPRHLRGVVVGANVLPPRGASVVHDGVERGALTSVGESLDLRAPVALAMVHRSVEPPAQVELRWTAPDGSDARVEAEVRELPLIDEAVRVQDRAPDHA